MPSSSSTSRGRLLHALLLAAVVLPLVFRLGSARAAPTELSFSEYIEGTSNNKALEIFNGTGAPIDLAANGYDVQMCFNGNPVCSLTIPLVGTVASGDVFRQPHDRRRRPSSGGENHDACERRDRGRPRHERHCDVQRARDRDRIVVHDLLHDSGQHTAAVSGGPTTLTLDPDSDFADGEACTVSIASTQVASHTSPLVGRVVSGLAGVVTARLGNGFYLQHPTPIVVEDAASGSVETSGIFDPAEDGIDFYESVEAMCMQVNDALVVGPRSQFGEIPVVGDAAADAGVDRLGIMSRHAVRATWRTRSRGSPG